MNEWLVHVTCTKPALTPHTKCHFHRKTRNCARPMKQTTGFVHAFFFECVHSHQKTLSLYHSSSDACSAYRHDKSPAGRGLPGNETHPPPYQCVLEFPRLHTVALRHPQTTASCTFVGLDGRRTCSTCAGNSCHTSCTASPCGHMLVYETTSAKISFTRGRMQSEAYKETHRSGCSNFIMRRYPRASLVDLHAKNTITYTSYIRWKQRRVVTYVDNRDQFVGSLRTGDGSIADATIARNRASKHCLVCVIGYKRRARQSNGCISTRNALNVHRRFFQFS